MMKRYLQNILIVIGSLLIFVILLEAGARLFWSGGEKIKDVRKGLLLEGTSRKVVYEGIEYQTNSYGIRNREIKPGREENIYRIMSLGDSFIWGDGQKNDELITVKLEDRLNKIIKDSIEVINTGIGGFNARDEYNQLLRLAPVYEPDAVIQFFFTNDMLEMENSGKAADWKVNFNMSLRKNSKFYSWLYYIIKSKINADMSMPQFVLPQDYFNLDDTKPGWVKFKKYTTLIKQYCMDKKLKYYFVMIPTLTNLDENYPYRELTEKVEKFVKDLDVPFLSFFNLFAEYKPEELWVSKENTHWNGKATGLAAEELARFIAGYKLIKEK